MGQGCGVFEGRGRSWKGRRCCDVFRDAVVEGYGKWFLVCRSGEALDGRYRRGRRGDASVDTGIELLLAGDSPSDWFGRGFVARLISSYVCLRPGILRLTVALVPLYNGCFTRFQRESGALVRARLTDRRATTFTARTNDNISTSPAKSHDTVQEWS